MPTARPPSRFTPHACSSFACASTAVEVVAYITKLLLILPNYCIDLIVDYITKLLLILQIVT
jgi:hypothetical protein